MSAVVDGGSPESSYGDFPSAEKLAPSSKATGGAAAAARHRYVFVAGEIGIQEGLFVISVCFWVFL